MNRIQNHAQIWQNFIKAELKSNSNLGKIIEKAGYGGYEEQTRTLTLYFPDEALSKSARGQVEKLKAKLKQHLLLCDRIDFCIGNIPVAPPQSLEKSSANTLNKLNNSTPLQALNFAKFVQDNRGNELSVPVLESAVKAEQSCDLIYTKLRKRTEELIGKDGVVISVSFNWRLRVGGTRGFRELLLPVFHPVFGIPYIPASSLKGAARAWAINEGDSRVRKLLGMLDGKVAQAAQVEFLDAFPSKHCLSVDVATPQWRWQNNKVIYKPEPHLLLSMKQPQFLIGLRPTAKGSNADVQVVREWLENALKSGIGSRVSSGYGRALGQVASLPCDQSYNFELWTQGIYGSEPPTKQNNWQGNPEFRPTAIRGILRYWFRAIALSLYDPTTCQTIEDDLFGKLGKQGKLAISVLFNSDAKKVHPYVYTGKICLEATDQKALNLISKLLMLASHLGGVGHGSRRPLHLLDRRRRGCHWSVDGADLPLDYNANKWQQFFKDLVNAFQVVRLSNNSYTSPPGKHKQRQQDVLDKNAQVWLLKSFNQIPPNKVNNWQIEGDHSQIRGAALNLLYDSDRFKGRNKDGKGNDNVGGALETPSFVWIKSIFSEANSPYQVVTIFGVDHHDRLAFAHALKNSKAELVFGQMPSSKQPQQPQSPQRR